MAAAISFRTEFLAPPIRIAPDRGAPARTTIRSTGCQYGLTMATTRATWPTGTGPADPVRVALNAPRDDIVREDDLGDGSFGCAEGPFRSYRRTLLDHGERIDE